MEAPCAPLSPPVNYADGVTVFLTLRTSLSNLPDIALAAEVNLDFQAPPYPVPEFHLAAESLGVTKLISGV